MKNELFEGGWQMNEIPKILDCNAAVCAYNRSGQCHAYAITVGDGQCPMCDTGFITDKKGGVSDITGKVGACKVSECRFNDSLECDAEGIHVRLHSNHADCGTYQKR